MSLFGFLFVVAVLEKKKKRNWFPFPAKAHACIRSGVRFLHSKESKSTLYHSNGVRFHYPKQQQLADVSLTLKQICGWHGILAPRMQRKCRHSKIAPIILIDQENACDGGRACISHSRAVPSWWSTMACLCWIESKANWFGFPPPPIRHGASNTILYSMFFTPSVSTRRDVHQH
jgi:hypothetical protein